MGGETYNITIQLVLQRCCKANVYFLPVFTVLFKSCVKQFKDEHKKFLLIIFLNLIILIMPTTMWRNFIVAGEGWGVLPSSRL